MAVRCMCVSVCMHVSVFSDYSPLSPLDYYWINYVINISEMEEKVDSVCSNGCVF